MTTLAFEGELPTALTDADELPSLPTVAIEVLRLAQKEDLTVVQLARCLSGDPQLAARIIELSNTARFHPRSQVTTLRQATEVLGRETTTLMAVGFSLVGSIPHQGTEGAFRYDEFWRRTLVRSVAASSLARLVGSPLGDEAFLCGLLLPLGRLVIARLLRDTYAPVLGLHGPWPSAEQERAAMGFSNADVCATLLREWDIPETLYLAMGYASRPADPPEDARPQVTELCHLLRTSALIEEVLCSAQKGLALDRLHGSLASCYGLETGEVEAFLIGLESAIGETSALLALEPAPELVLEEIMDDAKQQRIQVRRGTRGKLCASNHEREQLAREMERLLGHATADELTGLPGRAALDDFLAEQVEARIRDGRRMALGLILIEIDHFERLDDTHGHSAGDEVLRVVGRLLAEGTRKGDLSARTGGGAFAVVAPATSPFNLRVLSERLREAIEGTVVRHRDLELRVTASLGAACIATFVAAHEAQKLIELANAYLDRAQRNGGNRTEVHRDVRFPS